MDKKALILLSSVLAGIWLKLIELYYWTISGTITLGNVILGLSFAVAIPLFLSIVLIYAKDSNNIDYISMGLLNSFYFLTKGLVNHNISGTPFMSLFQTTIEAFIIGFPIGISTWLILNKLTE